MQRRDLMIGVAVLIIIALIVFFVRRRSSESELPTPTPLSTPSITQTEKDLEDKFKIQVPENAEKAQLIDPTGGTSTGIATREFKNGIFNLTALADLPDPQVGQFYQVWLTQSGQQKLMGRMIVAKGGYLLDTSSREDLRTLTNVFITEETKNDNQMETTVLQGVFTQ